MADKSSLFFLLIYRHTAFKSFIYEICIKNTLQIFETKPFFKNHLKLNHPGRTSRQLLLSGREEQSTGSCRTEKSSDSSQLSLLPIKTISSRKNFYWILIGTIDSCFPIYLKLWFKNLFQGHGLLDSKPIYRKDFTYFKQCCIKHV